MGELTKSHLEAEFKTLWTQFTNDRSMLDGRWIPAGSETRIIPGRKFEFDFVRTDCKVAVEIQGAIWKGKRGGHSSGRGLLRDYEKSNLAQGQGWHVFFIAADMMKDPWTHFQPIADAITRCGGTP